jgi:hypothetical protein
MPRNGVGAVRTRETRIRKRERRRKLRENIIEPISNIQL